MDAPADSNGVSSKTATFQLTPYDEFDGEDDFKEEDEEDGEIEDSVIPDTLSKDEVPQSG